MVRLDFMQISKFFILEEDSFWSVKFIFIIILFCMFKGLLGLDSRDRSARARHIHKSALQAHVHSNALAADEQSRLGHDEPGRKSDAPERTGRIAERVDAYR